MRLMYACLALVLLLMACSGEDDPDKGSIVPFDLVSVSWEEAEPILDLTTLRETPQSNLESQLLLVGADGTQSVLYQGRRRLVSLEWTKDGIQAGFDTTMSLSSPLLQSDPKLTSWTGTLAIDPQTLEQTTVFDPFLSRRASLSASGENELSHTVYAHAPTGRMMLGRTYLVDRLGYMDVFIHDDLHLSRSLKWDGPGIRSLRLSADGEYIAFMGPKSEMPLTPGQMQILAGPAYLLPFGANKAMRVDAVVNMTHLQAPEIITSHELLLLLAGTGESANDGRLVIFDTATGTFTREFPVTVTLYSELSWREPDIVQIEQAELGGQMNNVLLDLRSGEIRAVDPLEPPLSISPDGRRALRIDGPWHPDTTEPPSCIGPALLELIDVDTGQATVLESCPPGRYTYATWVDNDRFILHRSNSGRGRGGPIKSDATLINLSTGERVTLLPEMESYSKVFLYPDGKRMLLTGDRLRVFDRNGTLLEDLGAVAPGFSVSDLTWSPDGSSFVLLNLKTDPYR